MPCKWCKTFLDIQCSPNGLRTHLQPFAQHSGCEVMCHELMVDEAHDIVSEEDSREAEPQQHLPHQRLKPETHPQPLACLLSTKPTSII